MTFVSTLSILKTVLCFQEFAYMLAKFETVEGGHITQCYTKQNILAWKEG